MGRINELADIDIDSVAAVSDYCLKASQLFQDLQNELEFMSQYMKAECSKLPPADDGHMPKTMRAWQVSRHAQAAADDCDAAKKSMAKLYGAFRKHYVPERLSTKKSKIKIDD